MDENHATQQAIKKLLNHPNAPRSKELSALLERASQGEDITFETIELLSSHDNIRKWMHEQVASSSTRIAGAGSAIPPGAITPISVSKKWICPRKGCRESLPVIQEGEDAPTCPVHQMPMVHLKKG